MAERKEIDDNEIKDFTRLKEEKVEKFFVVNERRDEIIRQYKEDLQILRGILQANMKSTIEWVENGDHEGLTRRELSLQISESAERVCKEYMIHLLAEVKA